MAGTPKKNFFAASLTLFSVILMTIAKHWIVSVMPIRIVLKIIHDHIYIIVISDYILMYDFFALNIL